MKPSPESAPPARLASLDAYRGLVMLLMMGEVLSLCAVAKALPESGFWKFLCWHQSHVEWTGCSLHDLIQPSFSFLVGVALPFSIAAFTPLPCPPGLGRAYSRPDPGFVSRAGSSGASPHLMKPLLGTAPLACQ